MADLSKTVVPKSDQLNSDDLIVGTKTLTITGVSVVAGDQPVHVSYEGDEKKPWKPCKSMRRVLILAWGSEGDNYVGKKITVYNDPSVTWAGSAVGGIRITHMSDLKDDKPLRLNLTVTRGQRKQFTVKPIITTPLNALTDEVFNGFCTDLCDAKTMADLQKIAKAIKAGRFDKAGTEKLKGVYSESQEAIRAEIENEKGGE